MKKPRIIAVDVDEVCADLLTAWVNAYNEEYGDTLKVSDIKGWDLSKYARNCTVQEFYDLLHADLYWDVLPIEGALEAVNRLRAAGHRVIFVSSCVPGTVDDKIAWLVNHGFLTNVADFIACKDKWLIRADVLLDDNITNVEAFPGIGLLVNHSHNADEACLRTRVQSLADGVDTILNWWV